MGVGAKEGAATNEAGGMPYCQDYQAGAAPTPLIGSLIGIEFGLGLIGPT